MSGGLTGLSDYKCQGSEFSGQARFDFLPLHVQTEVARFARATVQPVQEGQEVSREREMQLLRGQVIGYAMTFHITQEVICGALDWAATEVAARRPLPMCAHQKVPGPI